MKSPDASLHPVPKPPARPKKARQWGSSLPASKGLPKKRSEPRRRGELACPAFLTWLGAQPCFLTGHRTGDWIEWQDRKIQVHVDAAHLVRTRQHGDLGFALPLCNHIHIEEQHRMGIDSWRKFYGLTERSVRDLAELYAAEFEKRHPDLMPKEGPA